MAQTQRNTPSLDVDRELGERAHTLMWRTRRTQIDIARAIGIDNGTFGRKLRGERKWALAEVRALAIELGTSVSYLIGEADEPPRGGASSRSNIVFPEFSGDRTGAKNQG